MGNPFSSPRLLAYLGDCLVGDLGGGVQGSLAADNLGEGEPLLLRLSLMLEDVAKMLADAGYGGPAPHAVLTIRGRDMGSKKSPFPPDRSREVVLVEEFAVAAVKSGDDRQSRGSSFNEGHPHPVRRDAQAVAPTGRRSA